MRKFVVAAIAALVSVGCTATIDAYKTAASREDADQRLIDTALVAVEHYAALIHEAADIKEDAATPQAVKDALRAAGNATARFVVGDVHADPPLPGVQDLVAQFQAVRNAENRAALDAALAEALKSIRALSDEIRKSRSRIGNTRTEPDLILAWGG